MALTAGTASLVSKTDTTANLSGTAATAGTGAVTYKWYRSNTSGFTPGAGNVIAGATSLALADSGLIPGSSYFYVLEAKDTVPTTVLYPEVAVQTAAVTLSQNQFKPSNVIGVADQAFNYNTHSCIVDASGSALVAGQAVKMVDSAGGPPKVVAATAVNDKVFGFVSYEPKSPQYNPLDPVEVAMSGNVLYLMATASIARGANVQLDPATIGGVAPAATSGASIVGWAYDKASAPGKLVRVFVSTPNGGVV